MGACGAGCASLVLGFLCSCLSPLVTHISRFGLALFVVLDLDYLMSRNGYYILPLFFSMFDRHGVLSTWHLNLLLSLPFLLGSR